MKQIRDLIGVHEDSLHQVGDRIEDEWSWTKAKGEG